MELNRWIYFSFGAGLVFFLFYFAYVSWREKKSRAAWLGTIIGALIGAAWFGITTLFSFPSYAYLFPPFVMVILTTSFFLPLGKTRDILIAPSDDRVDERDTMFAREEYQPQTDKYESYYARRPENKYPDDKIRSLPELMAPGGRYYDPIRSTYTDSVFRVISQMTSEVDGKINPEKINISAQEMTQEIKKLTIHLGADDVGIAALEDRYIYSHVGRGPEPYGSEIHLSHKHVIVFALEMDYEHVEQAPRLPITEETARQYLFAAVISIVLARHIRDMGYPARAHISGSNYQLMLPPVAYKAGLGELGRNGYLISPKFGARIRLGAVTTDLPLLHDQPTKFGVQDFCDICKRCATNCPSASIPKGKPVTVRGVDKWPTEVESCMTYWRSIGTDCGLCMKVCPFSHPATLLHNLVRTGIKNSSFARRVSLFGENFLYGKKAPY